MIIRINKASDLHIQTEDTGQEPAHLSRENKNTQSHKPESCKQVQIQSSGPRGSYLGFPECEPPSEDVFKEFAQAFGISA